MRPIPAADWPQAPKAGSAVQSHLTQCDLARRWRVSERTLERWRWKKTGVCYIKIGGKVVYRMADVLAFEAAQLRVHAGPSDPFFRKIR